MVGFGEVIRVKPSGPSAAASATARRSPESSIAAATDFRSAPAQNASVAGAGEDQDPCLVVGLELAIGLEELVGRVGIDRVPAFGPIDREHPGGVRAAHS